MTYKCNIMVVKYIFTKHEQMMSKRFNIKSKLTILT